jgi:SAM-dependent methyltransferase
VRPENLDILRIRYPEKRIESLDMEKPSKSSLINERFDIIHCYGLLYHLHDPAQALAQMGRWCVEAVFLETCVSPATHSKINPLPEDLLSPTQSYVGVGCRPTRQWVFEELKKHFEFVYLTKYQPNHEEFPIDWEDKNLHKSPYLMRSIFVASHKPIQNNLLSDELLMQQARHS